MRFDLDQAIAALAARAVSPRPGPWPDGAPAGEFTRSPAAMNVGSMSWDAGLFLFHYEHRAQFALPEDQVPAAQPELAAPPPWDRGVQAERKYQSFRHDLPIGSFHPHHRAAWSTHELTHGLVGFAWRPGATPLFNATAGRLAELLPVTLWYFFDPAFQRRCPLHERSPATYRTFCAACDEVAAVHLDDPHARQHVAEGLAFLDAELAAIARSRATGRIIASPHTTIDLCSDGLAYAAAHGARLESPAFHRFAAQFLVDGGGLSSTLDALEARVLDVAAGILGLSDPAPLGPSRDSLRWRWILQDVAWRVLSIWEQCEGEAADALSDLVDGLAAARASDDAAVAEAALSDAVTRYRAIDEEYVLEPTEELFAVGYALPGGFGRSRLNLAEGIQSCTPLTAEALEDHLDDVIAAFVDDDPVTREPLTTRWPRWLAARHPGHLADLARYEAALAAVPDADPTGMVLRGPGSGLRLAPGFTILQLGLGVVDAASKVETGAWSWIRVDDRFTLGPAGGDEAPISPTALVIGRDPEGEVLILDLDPDDAAVILALGDGGVGEGLTEELVASLHDLGVLTHARLDL
jgi:hypothetical protein